MAEDIKKQKVEQLNEEQLNEVAGGGNNNNNNNNNYRGRSSWIDVEKEKKN